MRHLLMFFLVCGSFQSLFAQKMPEVFEQDDRFGYKKPDGTVLIKARFVHAQDFSEKGLAFAVDPEAGWQAIGRDGKVLFKPFIYDNGPDYFSEGLARFQENGKIGFFDETGRKVISADFEFATPFRDGRSVVFRGAKTEEVGEHQMLSGGLRALINRSGKLLTGYIFKEIGSFSEGKAEAVFPDGKSVFIDRDGKILP